MDRQQLLREIQLKAVRSSGPGGQHVNKTSTKIVLYFPLSTSEALSEQEKDTLMDRLQNRITADGGIRLNSSQYRSQSRNKEAAIDRLMALLEYHLLPKKERKATRPSKKAVAKRLDKKKKQALKKANRKKPPLD